MKNLIPVFTAFAVAVLCGSAHAQLINIAVPNGSFESPAGTSAGSPFDTTPGNDTAAPLIDGWTAAMSDPNNANSYGVVNNSTLSSAGTSDGSQSAFMQVYFNGTTSSLTSTNSLGTIAANTTYTLTVAIGAPTTPSSLDNVSGTSGETASQADISLLANGGVASEFTLVNTSVPVGTEADYTTTFTTGASGGFIGEALTIQLEADKAFYPGDAADPGDESILFDNVRLTATPEPSTWALMLGGAGFLVLLTRRNLRRS
jgi:hypothetical protein